MYQNPIHTSHVECSNPHGVINFKVLGTLHGLRIPRPLIIFVRNAPRINMPQHVCSQGRAQGKSNKYGGALLL